MGHRKKHQRPASPLHPPSHQRARLRDGGNPTVLETGGGVGATNTARTPIHGARAKPFPGVCVFSPTNPHHSPWVRSHVTDEETETQALGQACPQTHSQQVAEPTVSPDLRQRQDSAWLPIARPHRKRLAECRAVPSTQGQVDMVSSAFHSPAQPPGPRLTVTAEEGSPRDGHLPDVTQHLLWGQNLNLGLSGSPAPPPPPPLSLKHEVRSAAHHEVQCQCRGQPARPIPGPGQSHLLSTPKTLLL